MGHLHLGQLRSEMATGFLVSGSIVYVSQYWVFFPIHNRIKVSFGRYLRLNIFKDNWRNISTTMSLSAQLLQNLTALSFHSLRWSQETMVN